MTTVTYRAKTPTAITIPPATSWAKGGDMHKGSGFEFVMALIAKVAFAAALIYLLTGG